MGAFFSGRTLGESLAYVENKAMSGIIYGDPLYRPSGVKIYLGDGTLNEYQIKIAGDYRYDLPYYAYLSKIVFELFGIKASIHKEKGVNTSILLMSSKNLDRRPRP